jgi:outer membrane protein assembly factor BamB
MMSRLARLALYLLIVTVAAPVHAEDWPGWRGASRDGVWREEGILERFPDGGLKPAWRVPIHSGYSGPAVAGGRVFVTDFLEEKANAGTERALALDETTGKVLWTHEWPARYDGLDPTYAIGPRATPTVDGDRVYVLGAMGALRALDAETGRILWKADFVADYGTDVPVWGMTAAPLVEGNLLICLVGGKPDATVVAFDKKTGAEVWRSLSLDGEPGYSPPVIVEAGGTRQLIIWHPEAVTSLDPKTGAEHWKQPFGTRMGLTVATPASDGARLLVSAFFDGSMLVELDRKKPGARMVWRGKSNSEIETDGLHALITTPFLDGDTVYGIGSYGQLRALDARTGERLWESLDAVVEKARWAAGFLVRNGDRYFIDNDRGELIIAELSPKGYVEIDRTELIEPTSPSARRRERGAVHWSHPAYANRHIVVRNDREIVRSSLAAE